MSVSVASVMRYCRNYFESGYIDGTFRITGNALTDVGDGVNWVYISGSMMHDGAWRICNGYLTGRDISGLSDEEFSGRVWLLAPPTDFLELCKAISEYEERNPLGSLMSETFGEYSYTRSTYARGNTSGRIDWQNIFDLQIAPYVHMYTEVR